MTHHWRPSYPILASLVVLAVGLAGCSDDSRLPTEPGTTAVAPSFTLGSQSAIPLSGTATTNYTDQFPGISCDPRTSPVTITGWVNAGGLAAGDAFMFGLVDPRLVPGTEWGSGAYAYFGHIGPNIRVGPSDGFLGGELNQVGANVPFVESDPNHIAFTVIIGDGVITVTYDGTDYVDTYGDIEDANVADAYAGAEFDTGAIPGWSLYPNTASVPWEVAIDGCVLADDEGPVTADVVPTPNPAAVGGPVDLSALVDDTDTGGSTIAAAEYTLDGTNWTQMDASDGTFDDVSETVEATLLAPVEPAIYELCVRGTDAAGNVGEPECAMFVVYDPSGGFATGGGWIESPDGAVPAEPIASSVWDQGFEADADGWFDADDAWYGTVARVSSGTGGIGSATGAWHAVLEGDADSGPFSRFDGYRDTWPGTWTAEIDVWLDPSWPTSTGFDYSVAASGSDGDHQRDFIFHVNHDASSGKLLVAGSNNTNFAPREDLESINHYEVTQAGWYTLQHVFRDQGGALAVDLNLLDEDGNVLWTETRFNAADLIPTEVGGNRYAWFTFISVQGGIAVDDHQLFVPVTPTIAGKATFGFVSKYKKGASTPDGNTEFQFKAADLNFHSESYDWLVVNQGGENAQFKGTGTINGSGAYGFMLWAGDHDPDGPDTFRIKIWDAATEDIVYDNGMDQPIAGGNIVVHDGRKK